LKTRQTFFSKSKQVVTSWLPVHAGEWHQFFLISILFFLISTTYNVLRPLKITIMVSAPNSGAEIIPFLKVWGILPGALFFSFLYAQLSKYMSREGVFYSIVGIFICFFILFFSVLFPFRDELEFTSVSTICESWIPSAKWILAMLRHWHLSLFYICSELWGSVVLSMLFWGFVNEISTTDQAQRFYGIFALGGNTGAIAAGLFGNSFSTQDFDSGLPFGATGWEQSVYLIVGMAILCQLAVLILFRFLSSLPAITQITKSEEKEPPKKIAHFTLRKAFLTLYRSPHLRYIACIVICYNFMFNLIDVMFTDQLHIHFGNDSGALNAFMSRVTIANGVIATFIALFVSGNLLRRFGWKSTALATPLVVMISCIGFFGILLFRDSFITQSLVFFFSCPVTLLAVYLGGIQNCLTRGLKYTLFDATKEMAFIPLSPKEQRQGKAVIDGVGSRFGKSGGSFFYQFLLLFLPSIAATLPYVGLLIFIIIGLWIYAVLGLTRSLQSKLQEKENASA
jgi:AAA family ATP:ADP antiporter